MAASKALILQGILGVAGLCASGVGGIGLGLGKSFLEVQSDAPSEDDSTIIPEAGALEDIKVGEEDGGDLGIPRECEGSCSLSVEQLKKLKFERKGDEEIEFEGLEDSDEFELLIEVSEDETNYPKGKKYTLRPKTIAGTVTIKHIKEGNIVLGKDQEVVVRETQGGGKLEHLLEEVNGLGIPRRCKVDEVKGETKTCELTQRLQLEKIKFETKGGEKIRVEGLNEGNIVTLTIEDKPNDEDNYPKGKKYTLRSNGYVLIEGVKGGNILLEKGKDVVIREKEEGGKLEEVIDEVDRLGIPKRCGADGVTSETAKTCYLIQKQLRDLRFEAKEGSQITVEGWSDISRFKLTIENKEGDEENYPKGKKYKLEAITGTAKIKNVKGGDIDIWDGQSVVIRETSSGDKLEKAPEEVNELGIPRECKSTCQLTEYQIKNLKLETNGDGGITVEGIKKAKTVILKIEDKQGDTENYPNGKKYILSVRNGQEVKIKGLKEGDIEIGEEVAVIREKQGERKLEKAPKYELDKLGIPRRCNADSATVSSIQTCELTKEELEKLKFETDSGSSITFSGLDGDDDKVELAIVMVNDDEGNYHKGKNKKYTFKAKAANGNVTIKGAKGGNIVLDQKKGVDFRETEAGNKLETYLDGLGIPRGCRAEEVKGSSDSRSCQLTEEHLKNLKFKVFEEKTGDVTVTGLKGKEKITLTISWSDDKNNYQDNKKYSFNNTKDKEDVKITKDSQEVKIEKKKETWFKNEEGQLSLVGAKSEIEIKKEKKLDEVREIVKKLGFEGSSKLSIDFTGGYDSDPTRHQQTKVAEFSSSNKNESDLKKIQFRALGGGAGYTDPSSLGFSSIKVFLDWDDNESKFPKNMKFSFLNQSFSAGGGYCFRKNGKSSVCIPQKSGSQMPAFKVEEEGGKWYLVKSD